MSRYEKLLIENAHLPISDQKALYGKFSGFYDNGVILIDKNLSQKEKLKVLYEELAHHELTAGNILDYDKPINWLFETKARRKANHNAIPFDDLISAYHYGVSNIHELSDYLELDAKYIDSVLKDYEAKYGLQITHKNYLINFNPLSIKTVKDKHS